LPDIGTTDRKLSPIVILDEEFALDFDIHGHSLAVIHERVATRELATVAIELK
jgi:hypothetical protein